MLPGVLVAIGLSVFDLMRRVARPHDAVEGFVPDLAGMHDIDDYPTATVVPGLVVYRYDSPLFFANAEDFRTRVARRRGVGRAPVEWFVLNAEAIIEVDITAVDTLERLRATSTDRGTSSRWPASSRTCATSSTAPGCSERIGEDHIFPTLPTAVEAYRRWWRSRNSEHLPWPGT